MSYKHYMPLILLLTLPVAGWGDDYVDDVYYWAGNQPVSVQPVVRTVTEPAATLPMTDTIWSQPADTVVKLTIRSRQ